MLGCSMGVHLKHCCKKNSSKLVFNSIRNLCTVRKGRKTKKANDVSVKVSNLKNKIEDLCSSSIPNNISDECNSTLKPEDGSSLSSLNTDLAGPCPPVKKPRKYVKSVKVEGQGDLKDIAYYSSEVQVNQTSQSALDHYGTSIKRPGMKPFSISKKKLAAASDIQDNKKTLKQSRSGSQESKETKGSIVGNVDQTEQQTEGVITETDKLDISYMDSVDLSQVIPKIRTPSIQRVQNLEVPSEWLLMGQSWTPSTEFLDGILNYPIDGLSKRMSCQGNSEFVECFVTAKKSSKVVPAVTTVLSKTMPASQAFALTLWRKRSIEQMGVDGFAEYQNKILTRGKQFHDTIQRYLLGESVQSLNIENLPLITNCWKSLAPLLNKIDDVIAVESEVLHPRLLYRGVIDCVVEIKGQPFVVEWKHSSRKRTQIRQNYDSPIQLMAYKGAINANFSYPFGVRNSLLVVAYDDGSPASVFHLPAPQDGGEHWHAWLKRLHTFWTQEKVASELEGG